MKLTVVGSSPAWPNPGGAQSGYLVEADGARVLLDCGPGVLPRLRTAEGWPRLDAIAITHFHLDHWGDLVPWVWGAMFGPAAQLPRVALWVPRGGAATLAALGEQLGTPDMFETTFELHEYGDEDTFTVGGLEIAARRVLHYKLEAYGFRVSANGSVLAYSGDTGPDDRLVELARDADLFVCEATLMDGTEEREGDPRGHLSPSEARSAFDAAGARRLLLTHRPSERPLPDGYEQVSDGQELEL